MTTTGTKPPLVSTFFYALSALFPDGERFFIHSVRNYQNEIDDPVLLAQIRGFIGQEAHHGHSHEGLNKAIGAMGFPMQEITERLQKRVAFDVYRLKVNNERLRKRVMVISIISLFARIAYYQFMLLKADRHVPSLTEWVEATRFFWGKKGILRDNLKSMRQFFRTGFHPWDIDQQYLIDGWQQRHPEVAALQIP